MSSRSGKRIYENVMFWVFVLPVFLPFTVFFILPFFMGIYYSFFRWNGISSTMKYIGVNNFIELFTRDSTYFGTLWFTIRYAVLTVILTNILAIILAVLLDMKIRSRNFLRATFFIPNVISAIIAGFIWQFIYSQGSSSIYNMTGLGIFATDWLGDANIAVFSTALVQLWLGVGYVMVIYLAGLQSIDTALEEAAGIDGASGFKKFFYITLPLIMPAITVNLFMTMSQAFRIFDLNIALTRGGPGKSTLSMALDIYFDGFSNNMTGYAAAKAVVLFLIVFTLTIFQIKITKSREVQA